MKQRTLVVVDDESTQLDTLAGYLRKQGFRILTADHGEAGVKIVRDNTVDLLLTDMRMPGMTGLDLLRESKEMNPDIGVVVMTAYGSVEDAVEAMKAGAEDYLQKPVDLDALDLVVQRVFERRRLISENRMLKEALHSRFDFRGLVSGSTAMEEVLNMAGRAAGSKATVLLRGESGTGKEVMARAIHLAGPRKENPFIPVNIAAVPETLVESEFFGHEKGAFTGADRQRKGRFESADGGTLFIDEIGDIPVSVQVKLLRVLQERAFQRVGGSEEMRVDVRVIAATNQDLEEMIRGGSFREDLFYRLNVVCLRIPPLRERREEIPLFVDHFLRRFADEEGRPGMTMSREAMDRLMKHGYPGNVRELENLLQRAVVLAPGGTITTRELPPHVMGLETESETAEGGSLVERVESLEKYAIRDGLRRSGGNQSEAARALGITERNLRYKMKKYGMK